MVADLDCEVDPSRARHEPPQRRARQKFPVIDPTTAFDDFAIEPPRGAAAETGYAEPKERSKDGRQFYSFSPLCASFFDLCHETLPFDRPYSQGYPHSPGYPHSRGLSKHRRKR